MSIMDFVNIEAKRYEETADKFISTPMSHVTYILSLVKSLFHFVVHLQRKSERFFVKDALKHGYMRASGGKLEIGEADRKSRNRIQFLDLSKSSATQEFVGNSKKKTSWTVEYPQLSDILLKEFEWFRRIHTTLVGNMLLPTPELHVALIGYLAEIQAEITLPVVQSILGVDRSVADRIFDRVQAQLQKQDQQKKGHQCVHTIPRKKKQCKKLGKLGDSVPLCMYHKASATIPST